MAATADGGGYWEVATDGGLFAFGDAQFYGSMGGKPLDKPIVGMAASPGGYFEVASDGGIFTFGANNYLGSMGGKKLNKPMVGMWATGSGNGYWEAASDGGIFNFSSAAPFLGSMAGTKLNAPVVGGALVPVVPTSSLTLTKTTTSSGYGAAGQTIPYSYLVTNSGATTLTGIAVTDDKTSVSCPSGTLAKGASETCTGTYTVTQGDVDSGSVTNTATAAGTAPSGTIVSSTPSFVTVLANSTTSSLSMTAAVSTMTPFFSAADDPVDYVYTVTNTGTTTLSDVSVSDAVTNPNTTGSTSITGTCPSTPLAPQASELCTATYSVTQADVDSGQATAPPPNGDQVGTPWVQDNATNGCTLPTVPALDVCGASAQNPSGAVIGTTDTQTLYDYGTGASASVSLAKSAAVGTTFTASGQVLNYQYVVTNTGTISLTGLSVTDQVSVPGDVTVMCPLGPADLLAPGVTETCTGQYTTTSTDVTNLEVTNNATVNGNDVDYFLPVTASDSKTVTYTGP
jgi:uncharacterized repeat protein (TIGR01451 family)